MLHGLLATHGSELLSALDSSPLWGAADASCQAAAMDAIVSQAWGGGPMSADSGYQTMAHCGFLDCASALEGMGESYVDRTASSSSAVLRFSSDFPTTAFSPASDRKRASGQSAKTSFASRVSHDSPANAEGMGGGRRSWQEALTLPPQAAAAYAVYHTMRDSEENRFHVSCPPFDCAASSIGSLGSTPVRAPSFCMPLGRVGNPSLNIPASMKAMFTDTEMKEVAKWQDAAQTSFINGQFSKLISVDVEGAEDYQTGVLARRSHTQTAVHDVCLTNLCATDASLSNENDEAMPSWVLEQPPSSSHSSRKRGAAITPLAFSSSSTYFKRAHIQNPAELEMSTPISVATASTTTRASRSSSRHPQGPALNSNGRPRAPQGSANDPQSIAARNRRERINARLKVLQELVPNGSNVDLVTMLEKAINYVKYLQLQLRVLSNDELWHATQVDFSEQGAAQEISQEANTLNESLH